MRRIKVEPTHIAKPFGKMETRSKIRLQAKWLTSIFAPGTHVNVYIQYNLSRKPTLILEPA